jgi:hypothetical protein
MSEVTVESTLRRCCRVLSDLDVLHFSRNGDLDSSAVTALREAVVSGPVSELFCTVVAPLVNELLAKSVPVKRAADVSPGQYLSAAITRPMRMSGMFTLLDDPDFFARLFTPSSLSDGAALTNGQTVLSAAGDDLGPSTSLRPTDDNLAARGNVTIPAHCRLMIVEALARNVAANRLLELRRLRDLRSRTISAGTPATPSSTAQIISVRKALDAIGSACESSGGMAGNNSVSSPAASRLKPATWTVSAVKLALDKVAKSIPVELLQPALQPRAPVSDKMGLLFDVHMEEYTLRRAALMARLQATLDTFCEAPEPTIERSALRALSEEFMRSLRAQPFLTVDHVVRLPRVAVLAAFAKVSGSAHRMSFPLRQIVIPNVPDRGGRVNTFGFDEKVAVSLHNANRDHAMKYASPARGGGGRGASRGGRAGGGASSQDASQAAAPSSNAHVDPNAVRGGQGGKWAR